MNGCRGMVNGCLIELGIVALVALVLLARAWGWV